jgi:hypothetical protein
MNNNTAEDQRQIGSDVTPTHSIKEEDQRQIGSDVT